MANQEKTDSHTTIVNWWLRLKYTTNGEKKIFVCVCEVSDGKRRKEELRWAPGGEGCGVTGAEGTDPQVPSYPQSRHQDWVRSFHWRWITLLNNSSQLQRVVVQCYYHCLWCGVTLVSGLPEPRWEEGFAWGWWISYFPWVRQAEITSWPSTS